MKAVIPVAGVGSRLRPHTYTQPKALIPVAGKPILAYIIDQLRSEGIEDIVLVIGYLGSKIQDFVTERYPGLNVEFVVQDSRDGLGHAIWLARDVVGDDEMLILLGDTIIDGELGQLLACSTSAVGIKKVDAPGEFGVAMLDDDDLLTGAVEKPRIPKSNLALVGAYKIRETALLMNCLEHNIEAGVRSNNGEFSLTDALDRFVRVEGGRVRGVRIDNWYDLGKREILLETNAILLRSYGQPPTEDQVRDSIIIGPVRISEGAVVENAIIGPNVSVGENTVVRDAILRDSIIGSFSHLSEIALESSIIGNDAIIKGHVHSLNIGDNTEIDLAQGR